MDSGASRDDETTNPPDAPAALVVAGPTAGGKSACALALAEALGGTIINADSMQVYRELRILTARPSIADEARVPHRLYGFLPGSAPCSAGKWVQEAARAIEDCLRQKSIPILVGGTGLYLNALIRGLSPIPSIPPSVRTAARALMIEAGPEKFHTLLQERDPETAARLPVNDVQRHVRAWEVLEATGRPLTEWRRLPLQTPLKARFTTLLLVPPREETRIACGQRFDAMMEQGAFEEVVALDALGLPEDAPVLKSHGVPELRAVLRGALALPQAVEAAKNVTRQYAKRQTTWFRTQFSPDIVVGEKFSESTGKKIFPKICQFLLTPQNRHASLPICL